MAMTALGMAI